MCCNEAILSFFLNNSECKLTSYKWWPTQVNRSSRTLKSPRPWKWLKMIFFFKIVQNLKFLSVFFTLIPGLCFILYVTIAFKIGKNHHDAIMRKVKVNNILLALHRTVQQVWPFHTYFELCHMFSMWRNSTCTWSIF